MTSSVIYYSAHARQNEIWSKLSLEFFPDDKIVGRIRSLLYWFISVFIIFILKSMAFPAIWLAHRSVISARIAPLAVRFQHESHIFYATNQIQELNQNNQSAFSKKNTNSNVQNIKIKNFCNDCHCEFLSFLHRKFKYLYNSQKNIRNFSIIIIMAKSEQTSLKYKKNHHLKRQPTGKTTRQGKFFIRPPYFPRFNWI